MDARPESNSLESKVKYCVLVCNLNRTEYTWYVCEVVSSKDLGIM